MKLIKLERNFMFNDIFNQEKNVSKLEPFISIFFDIPLEKVKNNLELIPRNLPKDKRNEAWKQVDLLLKLENMKLIINIEINNRYDKSVINRNVIYISKVSISGYNEGEKYKDIWTSRQINFNVNDPNNNKLISEYIFKEKESNEELTDIIEIDVINISMIDKICYNELTSMKEKIVYNFCKMLMAEDETEFRKVSELIMDEKESKDLLDQVKEKSAYSEYIYMESAFSSDEEYHEHLINEGIEQGKKENSIEIAKNMLDLNINIETISKSTKLSVEEIEKLKEES